MWCQMADVNSVTSKNEFFFGGPRHQSQNKWLSFLDFSITESYCQKSRIVGNTMTNRFWFFSVVSNWYEIQSKISIDGNKVMCRETPNFTVQNPLNNYHANSLLCLSPTWADQLAAVVLCNILVERDQSARCKNMAELFDFFSRAHRRTYQIFSSQTQLVNSVHKNPKLPQLSS